jgi:1,4-dihydroxy-6-naphthoate synthase
MKKEKRWPEEAGAFPFYGRPGIFFEREWMDKVLRIGHSPDPDDAFMFYGLAKGMVKIPGFSVEHVIEDIQSLNVRAFKAELEVTALSAHAYSRVSDRYALMRCGASMGRNYGPVVVAKGGWGGGAGEGALKKKRIAVPGEFTTAFLLLNLALHSDYVPVQADFAAIMGMVERGEVEAGLLIHEGQITYREKGFVKVLDLGEWWKGFTPLPLPLGLDAVRRDLGPQIAVISQGLRESIDFALAHEDQALEYALQFGRGIPRETGRRFVKMYVNADTQSLEGGGAAALKLLYDKALEQGLIQSRPDLTLY